MTDAKSSWERREDHYEREYHKLSREVLKLKKLPEKWRREADGAESGEAHGTYHNCSDELDAKVDALNLESGWTGEPEDPDSSV